MDFYSPLKPDVKKLKKVTSSVSNQSSPESKTVILGAPEVYVQVNSLLGLVLFSSQSYPSKSQISFSK